jgi:hypothetical protein
VERGTEQRQRNAGRKVHGKDAPRRRRQDVLRGDGVRNGTAADGAVRRGFDSEQADEHPLRSLVAGLKPDTRLTLKKAFLGTSRLLNYIAQEIL